MPCNSEHMNPTPKEEYRQRTAQLYLYAIKSLSGYRKLRPHMNASLKADAKDQYCVNDYTAELCGLITELEKQKPEYFNLLVYSPRDPTSRKLADWWEAHQENDKRREAAERKEKRTAKLIEQAKAKLTKEELNALLGRSE